jgi:fatty-acyl-CoA synthase
MESPLTPLALADRARRLYAGREAVVDGERRLTYGQFFDRCDRWSSLLQAFGIRPGDRVAYIAPNTHAQLESFYAVPQTGSLPATSPTSSTTAAHAWSVPTAPISMP